MYIKNYYDRLLKCLYYVIYVFGKKCWIDTYNINNGIYLFIYFKIKCIEFVWYCKIVFFFVYVCI